jgi:hypothetical protein
MNPYAAYPQIWTTEYYESLFVVRVPNSILSLDEKTYRQLMQERLDWMIQTWMEAITSPQEQTQALLVNTFSQLNSTQNFPLEMEELQTWRQAWAETLIQASDRFSELLSLQGINFPVTPLNESAPEYLRLSEIHQDTLLEEWLLTLIP